MQDDDRIAPAGEDTGNPNPQASTDNDTDRKSETHDRRPDQGTEPVRTEGTELAADADAGDKTGDPKPPRKTKHQRRVEELEGQVGHYRQQAEHYRGQLERSRQPKKLDPMDFASDAEYQRAVIEQTVGATQTEFARTQASAAEEQAALVEQQIWETRVADYEETVPDFKQVAYSAAVPYSNHGLAMVRQMPEGAKVAYFLGKNTAEAQRLAALPPLQTAFELGRLAQRLSGPQAKAVSAAPDPVPTLRGRTAATGFRPDSNDPDAYFAWRDKMN